MAQDKEQQIVNYLKTIPDVMRKISKEKTRSKSIQPQSRRSYMHQGRVYVDYSNKRERQRDQIKNVKSQLTNSPLPLSKSRSSTDAYVNPYLKNRTRGKKLIVEQSSIDPEYLPRQHSYLANMHHKLSQYIGTGRKAKAFARHTSKYDPLKKGKLNHYELYRSLKQFGADLTRDEINDLVETYDAQGSGYIEVQKLIDGINGTQLGARKVEDQNMKKALNKLQRAPETLKRVKKIMKESLRTPNKFIDKKELINNFRQVGVAIKADEMDALVDQIDENITESSTTKDEKPNSVKVRKFFNGVKTLMEKHQQLPDENHEKKSARYYKQKSRIGEETYRWPTETKVNRIDPSEKRQKIVFAKLINNLRENIPALQSEMKKTDANISNVKEVHKIMQKIGVQVGNDDITRLVADFQAKDEKLTKNNIIKHAISLSATKSTGYDAPYSYDLTNKGENDATRNQKFLGQSDSRFYCFDHSYGHHLKSSVGINNNIIRHDPTHHHEVPKSVIKRYNNYVFDGPHHNHITTTESSNPTYHPQWCHLEETPLDEPKKKHHFSRNKFNQVTKSTQRRATARRAAGKPCHDPINVGGMRDTLVSAPFRTQHKNKVWNKSSTVRRSASTGSQQIKQANVNVTRTSKSTPSKVRANETKVSTGTKVLRLCGGAPPPEK